MMVYLITDDCGMNVFAIFSSKQKAIDWLENKAVQEYGWTPGEVGSAQIKPWPVDAE